MGSADNGSDQPAVRCADRRWGNPAPSTRRSTSTGPRASPRTRWRNGCLARCARGSSSPTGRASLMWTRW
eukprot:9837210-Lingulodinium_polyedra.AAC.1